MYLPTFLPVLVIMHFLTFALPRAIKWYLIAVLTYKPMMPSDVPIHIVHGALIFRLSDVSRI